MHPLVLDSNNHYLIGVFRLIVSILIFSTVAVLLHYVIYIYYFSSDGIMSLKPGWRRLAKYSLWALGIYTPVIFILSRAARQSWMAPFVVISFLWMGVVFLLFCGALIGGTLHMGSLFVFPDIDPSRRRSFYQITSGALGLGAWAAAGVGVVTALSGAKLKRVGVTLKGLDSIFKGFTIVQISDLHIGPTVGAKHVESLVKQVNALSPDLIVLTGDIVDDHVSLLKEAVAPLAGLRSKHGSFFVTGNHEYYSGRVDEWIAHFALLGVSTLGNRNIKIIKGDSHFHLAGVYDHRAHTIMPDHQEDVLRACSGCADDAPIILLAHQPQSVVAAAAAGVALQISGHTHGGQIFPFAWLVRLTTPYIAGLYCHNENTQIYVSTGTAWWGPPMRLGTTPELTELILEPA